MKNLIFLFTVFFSLLSCSSKPINPPLYSEVVFKPAYNDLVTYEIKSISNQFCRPKDKDQKIFGDVCLSEDKNHLFKKSSDALDHITKSMRQICKGHEVIPIGVEKGKDYTGSKKIKCTGYAMNNIVFDSSCKGGEPIFQKKVTLSFKCGRKMLSQDQMVKLNL